MKKISIILLTLFTTLVLSGCGSDGSSNNQETINTIEVGKTKTLTAGTTITAVSGGSCETSIIVLTGGDWNVTNIGNDICQYN